PQADVRPHRGTDPPEVLGQRHPRSAGRQFHQGARPDLGRNEVTVTSGESSVTNRTFFFSGMAAVILTGAASAQDTRLLRHPTVSQELIAFEYGADLWVAPRSGGAA